MTWFRSNLLAIVAIAAAVVFGLLWWHARTAAAEARRGQEAAELRAQDLVVALELKKADLEVAEANSADFAEGMRRALAAAHGAKIVTVITGSTGPVVAGTPSSAPAPNPSESSPAPSCLLRPGDRGQIDVTAAELRTEAGNRVLVEAAEASRVEADGSKVRLFGGELRSDLTKYLSTEVKPEVRPGWGFGAVASLGVQGASLGPVLAFPPVRFLGLSLEASAGLTVVGEVRILGQVVVRP